LASGFWPTERSERSNQTGSLPGEHRGERNEPSASSKRSDRSD